MIDLEPGEEIQEVKDWSSYFVTSFGRVISGPKCNRHSYLQMAPLRDKKDGYLRVILHDGKKYLNRLIHILVAEAFIPNPEGKPTVNHKNGKEKWNNRVDNLEWAAYSEQEQHALSTGLLNLSSDWGVVYHKKGYQVQIRLPNVSKRYFKQCKTREEALELRDKICREHGLVRPIGG